MNKLRDFFYNISDIIMAVLVISLVVYIISWKINAIADYPEYVASLQSEEPGKPADNPEEEVPPPEEEVPQPEENTPTTPEENTPPATPDPPANPPVSEPKMITVTIPQGSIGSAIAKILLENQLIDSSPQFLARVTERKLDVKLRSGTFKIPSDATLDQVINILTGQS